MNSLIALHVLTKLATLSEQICRGISLREQTFFKFLHINLLIILN